MKIGTVKELLAPARLNPALQGMALLLAEVGTERIVAADLGTGWCCSQARRRQLSPCRRPPTRRPSPFSKSPENRCSEAKTGRKTGTDLFSGRALLLFGENLPGCQAKMPLRISRTASMCPDVKGLSSPASLIKARKVVCSVSRLSTYSFRPSPEASFSC